MRKILLLFTLVTALMGTCITASAQEAGEEDWIIGYNEDGEVSSRALPTDIQSVTIKQINEQVIPAAPFKENLVQNAEVIYRFKYKVTAKKYNGQPVTSALIRYIAYTGPVKGYKITNISSGTGYIEVDVRGTHNFSLLCAAVGNGKEVRSNKLSKTPTVSAKYERAFLCTAYNTPAEKDDTSGKKIPAAGIPNSSYDEDFLNKVKLNGTGKLNAEGYIHYNSSTGKFSYVDNPYTATGTVATANRTLAVDPYYVPRAKVNSVWKRARLRISGIGSLLVAEDGGSAIVGYHIDVYRGIGKTAMNGWGNAYKAVQLIDIVTGS